MSIIRVHHFRASRKASPVSGEHPSAAMTAYAHALAEARVLSFKLHGSSQVQTLTSAETKSRQSKPFVTRPFRMMRVLYKRWKAKRLHARHICELEAVIGDLDAHTLRDIGFDAMKEKANHPRASRSNALAQATKAVCEKRLTGQDD